MNITLLEIVRILLNVKVVYVLIGLIVIALTVVITHYIEKAIQKKKENNVKFAPLALLGSGVVWKMLIYVFAIAMIGATSFGLYQKIVQRNTSNTYTNQVSKCQEVTIDQRQISPEKKYLFRIELFGLDIHFINMTPKEPITLNNKITVTPKPIVKQGVKK